MTQRYKITCEVTVSVDDIPMPKEMMEEFFIIMLQRMFNTQKQGQQQKVIKVVSLDTKE